MASGLIKDPPQLVPFPVKTPVNSFFNLLYCPKRYPISLLPTPISPAGISLLGPICLKSSVIKLWQNLITSVSLLPLGSKSAPPFPPPIGRVVRLFLKICSKAKNFKILKFTFG